MNFSNTDHLGTNTRIRVLSEAIKETELKDVSFYFK